MNNLEFVTGTTRIYRLAGNDWFAVSQDGETVLLIDTDCALPKGNGTLVGLESRWSDGRWNAVDGEDGQALLDYTNKLVNKYLSEIKYAIKPVDISVDCIRCFNTPTSLKGSVHNAYMFPLSYDELKNCRGIGSKIYQNSNEACDKLKNESGSDLSYNFVWLRTFSGIGKHNGRCAWCLNNTDGDLSGYNNIDDLYRVAPAFYLKKDMIDHIMDNGEIVLKPEKKKEKDNNEIVWEWMQFHSDHNIQIIKNYSCDFVEHKSCYEYYLYCEDCKKSVKLAEKMENEMSEAEKNNFF